MNIDINIAHFWRTNMQIDKFFKNLCYVGLMLLFLSCFLEWYSVKIITSSGEMVVKWNYNLFSGWTSPLSDSFNELNRPTVLLFPLIINVILVVLIFFSGYIVAFTNLEKITPQTNKMLYGYGIMALPMLLVYYFWIFPWDLKDLYYPTMMVTNMETGLNTIYTIGLGNILAIISFPLIFAYSSFYFVTTYKFEKKENTSETIVQELIHNSQEQLDLDRLIAKEELKFKFHHKQKG
ncbi:MAG: hypothetical protein HWN81_02835 [Candidatus Lokiarchaeota archaeon]|nr:hypothetical protein [Candidatus Lokiarchaeota archaeon]